MVKNIFLPIFFLLNMNIFSQKDSLDYSKELALGPSKSAFYSAVVPGLGQLYNKKYWKIPIVYGGLATSIYFYQKNNNEFHRYRDAYKRRLAGFSDDEFFGNGPNPLISNDGLIRAQNTYKRNKELSILITIGIYVLNIIDANVDAHLRQYNLNENLTIKPHIKFDEIQSNSSFGLSLNINL